MKMVHAPLSLIFVQPQTPLLLEVFDTFPIENNIATLIITLYSSTMYYTLFSWTIDRVQPLTIIERLLHSIAVEVKW